MTDRPIDVDEQYIHQLEAAYTAGTTIATLAGPARVLRFERTRNPHGGDEVYVTLTGGYTWWYRVVPVA